MPRLLSTEEAAERHAARPADHDRNLAAARRDGLRDRYLGRPCEAWPWDDHQATTAAYLQGYNGQVGA